MAWQRVALVVDGARAESLAAAFERLGALSVEWVDADAGTRGESPLFAEPGASEGAWPRARVSALFPPDADVPGAIGQALAEAGVQALEAAAFDRLADTDWVRQTQSQFAPIAIGERLWIVPSWHEAPSPPAVAIHLDPGGAFGTGSHPTTRLMLAWLERRVRTGDAVLDYGCGSGILAIAALKLGAGTATGVDIDPLALEAARYNAARNGVSVALAGAGAPIPGTFRITVANILANPLRMLAPLLAGRTAPGGWLALSGILEDQAAEVIASYAPWCALDVQGREGGWVLLAGTRPAAC